MSEPQACIQGAIAVRTEKLDPMRVARFLAFGRNPEQKAWADLFRWAEPQRLLEDPAAHPIFGFNNPAPVAQAEEYGYELWIRIAPELPVAATVETIDFSGGWYAVMTHPGLPNPAVWRQLLDWVRRSHHRHRLDHELEHPHNPLATESAMVFDLYLPIEPVSPNEAHRIKIRGIDFIMYPVTNLNRSATFYRETLGLPQELYSEEWQWAEFNCGNVTLALKGSEKVSESTPGGRIALAVEDVHAACSELKSKGFRVLREPVDYGVCCAAEIADPDGNVIILHKRADGSWGQASCEA